MAAWEDKQETLLANVLLLAGERLTDASKLSSSHDYRKSCYHIKGIRYQKQFNSVWKVWPLIELVLPPCPWPVPAVPVMLAHKVTWISFLISLNADFTKHKVSVSQRCESIVRTKSPLKQCSLRSLSLHNN